MGGFGWANGFGLFLPPIISSKKEIEEKEEFFFSKHLLRLISRVHIPLTRSFLHMHLK
jgi:hypothetical protein